MVERGLWIALGTCALLLVIVRLLRRPASTETVRLELERLLAEIRDVSRNQIAALDSRIRMLSQLLQECDRKKAELDPLIGRAAAPAPLHPSHPLHDQVYALQDQGRELPDICGATGLEKGEVDLILGLRRMPPVVP